jgi:hypothetical protein
MNNNLECVSQTDQLQIQTEAREAFRYDIHIPVIVRLVSKNADRRAGHINKFHKAAIRNLSTEGFYFISSVCFEEGDLIEAQIGYENIAYPMDARVVRHSSVAQTPTGNVYATDVHLVDVYDESIALQAISQIIEDHIDSMALLITPCGDPLT